MPPRHGYRYSIRGVCDHDEDYQMDNLAYRLARELVDTLHAQGQCAMMTCETPLSTRILDRYRRRRDQLVNRHFEEEHDQWSCAFATTEPILCGKVLPAVATLAAHYHDLMAEAYEREHP